VRRARIDRGGCYRRTVLVEAVIVPILFVQRPYSRRIGDSLPVGQRQGVTDVDCERRVLQRRRSVEVLRYETGCGSPPHYLNSERIPPFTAGVNRVRSVPQTTGDCPTGTPIFSITCVKDLRTGSADSHRRHAAGVGPHSTHVCGAPQARLMAFGREGVTGAGIGIARFDRLGESRVEKPRGDDSLADGSTRGGATGRSRPRDETRPADAGRDGPETDRKQSGFPLSREPPSFTTGRTSRRVQRTLVLSKWVPVRSSFVECGP
jgi:hypothetical protein